MEENKKQDYIDGIDTLSTLIDVEKLLIKSWDLFNKIDLERLHESSKKDFLFMFHGIQRIILLEKIRQNPNLKKTLELK